MKKEYLNIYNNLIKLTRNKSLFKNLTNKETFSDRIILFFFHFGFFLKVFKNNKNKSEMQDIFDFIIRQIELSIREIGYGDASVNKKMKSYINVLFSIIDKIDRWEVIKEVEKRSIIEKNLDIDKNQGFYVNYFDNYYNYLTKNTLNNLSKDIINMKF
tara:strand:- start:120 stop:593 length:474 start_codon:yes stop_codon:yes gene_type:complete